MQNYRSSPLLQADTANAKNKQDRPFEAVPLISKMLKNYNLNVSVLYFFVNLCRHQKQTITSIQ